MPGGTMRGRCSEEELAQELAVPCPQPHLLGARFRCKGRCVGHGATCSTLSWS